MGFGPTMGSLSELAFLFVPAAFESSFLLRPLRVCGTKHTIAEAPTAAVLVVPVVRSSLVVATRLAVVAFVVCFSGCCCCCCCYRGSADKRLPACCCAAVVCPRPPSFLVCVAFHNFAQQLPVRLSLSLSLSLCVSLCLSLFGCFLFVSCFFCSAFFSLFLVCLCLLEAFYLAVFVLAGTECVCVFRVFLCGVLEERKREDLEEWPRLCVGGCCLVSDQVRSGVVAQQEGNCACWSYACVVREQEDALV